MSRATASTGRRWLGFLPPILSVLIAASATALGGYGQTPHTFGDPNLWQWAPSRTYHVKNYRLALHFDEAKGEVFGDERITLQAFAPHFRTFYLDSSELAIDTVTLKPLQGAPVKLAFAPQGDRLWITLDRDYDAATTVQVRIVYHGFPRTGLFFVNPTRDYPNWPREVYSQGETEFNHYWFPCWDYPNDMATSETITTVPQDQSVVSNGKLVQVTRSDGFATYDWVESVPHSSYLTSIAVGPWRKVADTYKNKPVDYYVPNSASEETARRSFHLTPDMMAFFSRATGVEYPYEQYAQTTVQNYIFGGQENVSATTLTATTLHDAREDPDYPSTGLVSHELGQEWLGDFVQGRDWANIWLNEGFATYLAALYTQFHDGNDAFRLEIHADQLAAQAQDQNDYLRPIVERHYTDPMQMFDAITHQKGAAVLDMLRFVLDGQEAPQPASQNEPFFQAVHRYLETHATQAVDTPAFLEAIRATTGQELGWFFREWVYLAGYPEYRVQASYDASTKSERLTVAQTQHADGVAAIFDMPIEVAFHGSKGERKEITVRNHLRQQEFDIPLDFAPQWVDFDPDDVIDKTVEFDQPVEALIAAAEKDPATMSRLWATEQLGAATRGNPGARAAALVQVLGADSSYAVRAAAASGLDRIGGERAKAALLLALRQPDRRVRTAAVTALAHFAQDQAVWRALVDALHGDESYAVEAAAATAVGGSGAAPAFDVLQAEAAAKPEAHVMGATLAGLASTGDPRAAPILLAEARPGVPEPIRLSALTGLGRLQPAVERTHASEMDEVVRAARQDPFLPVEEAGDQLAGIFHLTQFAAPIRAEAQGAATMMQRDSARQALEQLYREHSPDAVH